MAPADVSSPGLGSALELVGTASGLEQRLGYWGTLGRRERDSVSCLVWLRGKQGN